MDPSESEHRPASFSDSSENSQPTSGPSQQQSAEDISIAGEDNAIALANAAGNVTIDQSQRGSIRIEESTVGSAIISGNGNIVYVVHQATEPKNIKASEEPFSDVGPNPYKGLAAFKESNAHQYFGREAQVKRLWQRFQSLYEQSGQANAVPRLLPILGPSGSGKSSLARAGLIPELARHPLPGKEQMRIAVLVPGTHPLETLAGVLAKAATQDPMPVAKTREFATELKLKNESGLYDGMRRIVDLIPQIKDMPLIVLVDQFEEVYSLCQAADERDSFIENLLCAASSPTGNVSVVLTLRSDFLGETQRHKLLNQVICSDRSVIVPVMTEVELRRAIAEPAKQAGHPLDAATVNLLVKDTEGREGALPLLQFALTRIWAGLSEGKAPADTYEAMGGVGGALAGKAQDIYNELDDAEKDMVRRVFIGLVQLGEGTRDTRRRAAVSSLMASRDTPEAIKQVIHRFSSPGARLVTLSSQAGKEIAEVTHEALFDHWQLLNDWLDSGRDDIRFQRRLDAAADYWKEQDYPEGSLWRRPDLDLLKSYHRQASHEMTPLQLSFFRASMRAAQRRKIFMSMGVGSLVMLSAATSLLAITAQRTKRESLASQLATKSEWIGSQSSVLRTTSALLAVKASETFNHDLNAAPLEIDQALRSGLKFLPDFKHQLPHESEVLATSFSPNSQIIATASTDNAAWLWAADTGEKIATLPHEDEVLAVNFSPSGQTVATASADNTARIWNVDTGEKIVTLPHEDKVLAVSFSPSGQTVATASADNTARIWDANTGEKIVTLPHEDKVLAVSFSPSGQTVATASADNTARIWNADTREKIAILPHEDKVLAVSFSPSGQTVATASSDSTARLWDADTGKTIAILQHEAPVLAVNFSPNGQTVATASYDNTARLWNADTGEETATLNHDAIVSTVSFSPDGQTVATASADNTARFWNADTGEETATLNHEATVSAVSFSPDGQTAATVSHDNIARLWSAEAGEEIATFNHEATVSAVSFSPNGQTVATASYDNTARLWSTDTEEEIAAFQHEAPVLAVSFGPNGQTIATASYDNTARLWSTDTKEEIAIFQHEAPVLAVSFGPNGQTVATASADNTARLWSTDTKEEIAVLQHEAPVLAVSFGPNGQTIVTTSDDGTARLWEADTGEKIATLQHETTVRAANLSPNGKTVATASDDGTAWLWAADTGKKIAILQHEAPVSAVSFGPNSKTVATASADNTARLWSANTGEELATLNHEAPVSAVSFSSDSKTVVTASADNTARLWSANTGEELATLNHEGKVLAVSFSPDDSTIATASADTTTRLWHRSRSALVEKVCQSVSRNLTAFEWSTYLKADLNQYEVVCPLHPVHPSVLEKNKKYAQPETK